MACSRWMASGFKAWSDEPEEFWCLSNKTHWRMPAFECVLTFVFDNYTCHMYADMCVYEFCCIVNLCFQNTDNKNGMFQFHEFRAGTPAEKDYFLELWDIGGSSSHRNSRSIFYHQVHGQCSIADCIFVKSMKCGCCHAFVWSSLLFLFISHKFETSVLFIALSGCCFAFLCLLT